MKKIVVSLMIAISSVFGAVAGAGNDGRIMDKLFMDIYLSNGQVNYQYAKAAGGTIDIYTRSTVKALSLIEIQKVKPKIIFSGKIALPNDIGKFVTVAAKGRGMSYVSTKITLNNKTLLSRFSFSSEPIKGTLNTNVLYDHMNNPYLDFRYEGEARYNDEFKYLKETISSLQFTVSYQKAQTQRGQSSSLVTVPARFYCLEE